VVRAFWSGWLAWSREQGIDYQIGRTLASRLADLELERIDGTAETAIYNGTSLWADYWTLTVKELREDLMSSAKLSNPLVDTFLGYCAESRLADANNRLYRQFTVTPLVIIDPLACRVADVLRAKSPKCPAGAVVICGETSNFRRCNEPGFYFNRDCSRHLHTVVNTGIGGA